MNDAHCVFLQHQISDQPPHMSQLTEEHPHRATSDNKTT